MTQTYADQLRAEAARLEPEVAYSRTEAFELPLKRLFEAEQQFAKAWSGSNLGFHSCIYYKGFQPPPPGAHFSAEWGFQGRFQGTTGEWVEFQRDEVRAAVRRLAGDPDIEPLKARADEARRLLDNVKADVVSILSAFLAFSDDEYVDGLKDRAGKVSPSPTGAEVRAAFPGLFGPYMSRDAVAIGQGAHMAPHEEVRVEVESIRHSFMRCEELMKIALRTADHIDRLSQRPETSDDRQRGTRVFIGHGRSPQWRELKDFIWERLSLPLTSSTGCRWRGRRTWTGFRRCSTTPRWRSSYSRRRTRRPTGPWWRGRTSCTKRACSKGVSDSHGRSSCSRTAASSSPT